MKLKIPFQYNGRYKAKRGRKWQSVLLQTEALIEIAECEAHQPPAYILGHSIPTRRISDKWDPFGYKFGKPVRIWKFDETLFAEFCPVSDFVASVLRSEDNPYRLSSGELDGLPFFTTETPTSLEKVSHGVHVGIWEDDGGESKLADLARRSKDMRIVDGNVCVLVEEPVTVVEIGEGLVTLRFAQAFDWDTSSTFKEVRLYTIDDLDKARRDAAELAEMVGARLHSDIAIEAFSPAAIQIPQAGQHLHFAARALARSAHNEALPEFIKDAAVELRRCLDACPANHATIELALALDQMIYSVLCSEIIDQAVIRDAEVNDDAVLKRLRSMDVNYLELADWLFQDLKSWRVRDPGAHDWADQAMPVAAARPIGIQQILSSWETHRIAAVLSLPATSLLEFHLEGYHLLHSITAIEGKEHHSVVIADAEFRPVAAIGPYGIHVGVDPSAEAFLLHNAQLRMELNELPALILQ